MTRAALLVRKSDHLRNVPPRGCPNPWASKPHQQIVLNSTSVSIVQTINPVLLLPSFLRASTRVVIIFSLLWLCLVDDRFSVFSATFRVRSRLPLVKMASNVDDLTSSFQRVSLAARHTLREPDRRPRTSFQSTLSSFSVDNLDVFGKANDRRTGIFGADDDQSDCSLVSSDVEMDDTQLDSDVDDMQKSYNNSFKLQPPTNSQNQISNLSAPQQLTCSSASSSYLSAVANTSTDTNAAAPDANTQHEHEQLRVGGRKSTLSILWHEAQACISNVVVMVIIFFVHALLSTSEARPPSFSITVIPMFSWSSTFLTGVIILRLTNRILNLMFMPSSHPPVAMFKSCRYPVLRMISIAMRVIVIKLAVQILGLQTQFHRILMTTFAPFFNAATSITQAHVLSEFVLDILLEQCVSIEFA